jgi:peptide chain release factor subunit 3
VPPRDPLAPFRMAVIDKFKDLGTVVMGKSESGAVRKGDTLLLMPNR